MMPNMLAHLGVGGVITRAVMPDADSRWIYLGCVIPDLPWILQRCLQKLPVEVDLYDLRLYAIAQASLAGCLLLSGALALVTAAAQRVFLVLALNSFVHLLLDACQTKWGNGVHLLAPFSWQGQNFGLFWPESVVSYVLTAFGVFFFALDWYLGPTRSTKVFRPAPPRIIASMLLAVAFLLMPFVMKQSAFCSNVHYVKTLVERESRPGRAIELDRGRYVSDSRGRALVSFAGEHLNVAGNVPDRTVRLSVRGKFVDEKTVVAEQVHEHIPVARDAASFLGLALVLAAWLAPFRVYVGWGKHSREHESD